MIIIIVYWTLTANANIWECMGGNTLDIFPYLLCCLSISDVLVTWLLYQQCWTLKIKSAFQYAAMNSWYSRYRPSTTAISIVLIYMYIYTCVYTYVATLVEYKKMTHVPSYISHPLVISHNYLTTRCPLLWYSVLDIVAHTALYGPLLSLLPLNSMDIRWV